MAEHVNLLSCPMCGKSPDLLKVDGYHMVTCSCGVNCEATSANICLTAWNRRAAPIVGDDGLPPLPDIKMLGTSRYGTIFYGYTAEQVLEVQQHAYQRGRMSAISDYQRAIDDAIAADRAAREKTHLAEMTQWARDHGLNVPPAWEGAVINYGSHVDKLPKWIDDQKGADPLMDDVIAYIERTQSQYAERIRQLERELKHAKLQELVDIAQECDMGYGPRAQQQAQSIDTPEFREIIAGMLNEYWESESHIAALIAYIDGRTAGAAPELYTCKGKGGTYELIGHAWPAGVLSSTLMVSSYPVYRDTKRGQLFVRTVSDFEQRMERIAAAPSPQPGKEGVT